jgi:TPR repeat protein
MMPVKQSCVRTLCIAVCFHAFAAIADDFDEATAAYKDGRYETAAQIFEELAEKGDYRAMSIIGSMYEAFIWLKAAAKHNRPDAEYRLGLMYDHGLGVRQDHKKAVRWYRKAVEHGYLAAQAMMGLKYAKGEGFKQDKVKAYAWLTSAEHYFNSDGVEPGDLEKAFPFADRRAIREVFESLEAELTAEEKQTAAGLAREIAAAYSAAQARTLTE